MRDDSILAGYRYIIVEDIRGTWPAKEVARFDSPELIDDVKVPPGYRVKRRLLFNKTEKIT